MLLRAAKKELAAQFAGARSEVEDIIGCGDGLGVVLDHEDGISQIAQALETFDQPVRVARMQADGRLIKDVERADQLGSQGRGKLDALGFAAGKRGGEAIEREIFEPHLIQEAEPLLNLLQDSIGDGSRFRRQFERVEKLAGLGNGQLADFGNGFSLDAHGASFGAQPRTTTIGAGGIASIPAEKNAHMQLVFLSFEPGEKRIDARKVVVRIALDDEVSLLGGELAERNIERNAASASESLQILPKRTITRLGPGLNDTFVDGLAAVGNHQIDIEIDRIAEALATRAGAVRIVKRKQARLGLLIRETALLAFETIAEDDALRLWMRV